MNLAQAVCKMGFKMSRREIIPELVLLGSPGSEEVAMPEGTLVPVDFVELEGTKYIMKLGTPGRWFGE